jgi:cGMP-dependent protein kinase
MMLCVVLSEEVKHNAGDVIAVANGPVTNKIFLVKSGEVVLVPADVPLPGEEPRT